MLKQLREEVGMSQGELADELGKTAQYISNIEKGKIILRPTTLPS